MTKEVKMALKLDATKKHSVLFKPADDEKLPAVTGLYLMKDAFKELGEPKEVVLTIEST